MWRNEKGKKIYLEFKLNISYSVNKDARPKYRGKQHDYQK